MARSIRRAARATRFGLGLLPVLILAVGACLGGKPGPQASSTPTPLPAPQGLAVTVATPGPAPALSIGVGHQVTVEGLTFRVLAFQLPQGPSSSDPAVRDAVVLLTVRQESEPGAELDPWAQMYLEDERGRQFQLSPSPRDADDGAAPFRLKAGEERELRLRYRLPGDAQRVRWLFLPAGAGAPALTVDFGPLPPGRP